MQRPTSHLHVGLFREDLSDRIRTLHEELQAKMSRAPQRRCIEAVLLVMTMIFPVLSFPDGADAAEDFKKLSDAQIGRTFAGMEFTDQVHWAERYGADGTLTTREMGKTRVGSWRVEDDQLCVDLGKEGGRGCYEVWISGNRVELRTQGSSAYPAQGVLQRPTKNQSAAEKVKREGRQ
jgi:hypothetical protein